LPERAAFAVTSFINRFGKLKRRQQGECRWATSLQALDEPISEDPVPTLVAHPQPVAANRKRALYLPGGVSTNRTPKKRE
jgi:hypothetical protein